MLLVACRKQVFPKETCEHTNDINDINDEEEYVVGLCFVPLVLTIVLALTVRSLVVDACSDEEPDEQEE